MHLGILCKKQFHNMMQCSKMYWTIIVDSQQLEKCILKNASNVSYTLVNALASFTSITYSKQYDEWNAELIQGRIKKHKYVLYTAKCKTL
jgi:hypothetical protein